MEASLVYGHATQNWEDADYAARMRALIRYKFESTSLVFNTVLSMAADSKHWDSLRKHLGNQPRVRIANPRRGPSPVFYVLLAERPPDTLGRLKFDVASLTSRVEVIDLLNKTLVADKKIDITAHDSPFNKYSTNVEELKLHQNHRESDGNSEWKVFAGSPAAFGKYAQERGAEVKITKDKKYMYAEFPKNHDQFKFQYWPAWPSGNEPLENEPESEVTNE